MNPNTPQAGQPSAPTTAPLQVFEHQCDIQADEVYGWHVNFANFFRYVSHAFNEWYALMGLGIDRDHSRDGPVMATMTLDLLDELFYPGQVRVRLTVTRVGRSSLEHQIEVFNVNTGSLCARGRSINVWKDHGTGKSAAWPSDFLARCWV